KRDCPDKNGEGENDEEFAVGEERFTGWLIESGASSHMALHREDRFDFEETDTGIEVTIADGKNCG
ncbi:Integrase, catalytic core protein, partial [Phytophthora cinnamomi]|uniref:Integrase, catalytic core protein n=1 Tax=Phytophthora cinnamomi TaxID=4785 RepID=UPI00355961B9